MRPTAFISFENFTTKSFFIKYSKTEFQRNKSHSRSQSSNTSHHSSTFNLMQTVITIYYQHASYLKNIKKQNFILGLVAMLEV